MHYATKDQKVEPSFASASNDADIEAEILKRVEPRFESASKADEWYRSKPLPGFAGQTAAQLVRKGRGARVMRYLDAVEAGIHA